MIVGCTGNYRKSEYLDIVKHINEFLLKHNTKCIVSSDILNSENYNEKELCDNLEILDFSELENLADIILCIGGDGTFLSTARRMDKSDVPLLGIHIGGLGFLAEISIENLNQSLKLVVDKKYKIEERMRIELLFNKNGSSDKFIALNDIVVDHGESGRILKTKILVNEHYLNTYESDGMIISTAIGSTAYSLSAGGPIVHPLMDAIIVTPICSHSLSARSIVLDGGNTINMEFPDLYHGVSCTIDGQQRFLIDKTSKLEIKRSDKNIKVAILPSYNYFDTLRNKMRWSGNLR